MKLCNAQSSCTQTNKNIFLTIQQYCTFRIQPLIRFTAPETSSNSTHYILVLWIKIPHVFRPHSNVYSPGKLFNRHQLLIPYSEIFPICNVIGWVRMVAGLTRSSISGTRGQHQFAGNKDRFLIAVQEVSCYQQNFSDSVGGLAEPVRTLSRTDRSPSCQKPINLFSLMKIRELLTLVYIRLQSARTMQSYVTLRRSSQFTTVGCCAAGSLQS